MYRKIVNMVIQYHGSVTPESGIVSLTFKRGFKALLPTGTRGLECGQRTEE